MSINNKRVNPQKDGLFGILWYLRHDFYLSSSFGNMILQIFFNDLIILSLIPPRCGIA